MKKRLDSRNNLHFMPPKVHRYELPGGWIVLAGKTDYDNEILSTGYAKPDDWWFHVRGAAGSHVVLQAREGEEPDRETLERAAGIAAYHSKERNAAVVAVSCTQVRHVTKFRGAKCGTVSIRKEKILKVRPMKMDGERENKKESGLRSSGKKESER